MPEKFEFHLPEQGFCQSCEFRNESDRKDLACHLTESCDSFPLNGMMIATEGADNFQTLPPEVTQSALDHGEGRFILQREDYSVRNEIIPEIEKKIGRRADRECFKSPRNSLCTGCF